jgi:WD40 repeat protein
MMRIFGGALATTAAALLLTSGAMPPADLLQTYSAHHAAVNALAMTPDGTVGFSGGKDGKIILWDAASGSEIMEIPACQVGINDIAISPDGTLAATAGADGFVKIWDAQTGDLVTALAAHSKAANTVAWTDMSGLGMRIYSGGDDGYIRGYSVDDDYAMVNEWYANEGGVNAIVINAAGSYLFSGGVDGRVLVYGLNDGTRQSVIQAYENAEVLCLSLSSMENCLLTGGTNGEIRGWDATTGSMVKQVRAHAGNVTHVAWTEGDKYVLSSGEDGKIKLWNHDAELAGQFQAHVLGVRDFVMGDGYIITAGSDFKIRSWKSNF